MIPQGDRFVSAFGPNSFLSGCDFRPSLDGWLYNACYVVDKLPTRELQESSTWTIAQAITQWLLENRSLFSEQDRFQVIVGWPESVRRSGRQIVKVGGTFKELQVLIDAKNFTEFERVTGQTFFTLNWDLEVFDIK